jgi:SOS-response transcriptional repressor LexA
MTIIMKLICDILNKNNLCFFIIYKTSCKNSIYCYIVIKEKTLKQTEEVGKKLRKFRKNRGWTLKEMGGKLELHWTTIQAWEKGKYGIPSTKVVTVCKLLGISPSLLFEEKPDKIFYPFLESVEPNTSILAPENISKNINIKDILPTGADFALLKVESDSMKNAGILKGDWAVIDTSIVDLHIKNVYAIAIFHNRGKKGEITLKKIEKVGSTVILIPSNIEYDIQVYHKSEIQILGKVVRVLRAL